MIWLRSSPGAIAIALVLGLANGAWAQSKTKQPGAQQSSAETQRAAKQTAESVEGAGVYGPEGQAAEGGFEALPQSQGMEVATNAGYGAPLGYANASILELGAVLALRHASDTTEFRIAPSAGYFLIDNFEVTLYPELMVVDVEGETDFVFGALLEPSYHLPFSDRVFAFGGLGVGLRYADDPGLDFVMRPKIGMDFLIGRSGILKPALFMDIGTHEGLTAGGFEAGFTVIL